jgi:tetratricopeptide (TPR) repeat protein
MPASFPSEGPTVRRHLLLVGGAALAVRLLHLWQLSATPFATVLMGDALSYDTWARGLADGAWWGTEVFYQAPLYPYLLGVVYALTGADPMHARLVQALLGTASALMLATAVRWLVSPRAGVVAGLLLALYAPAIFLESLLQKSAVDLALVTLLVMAVAAVVTQRPRATVWWGLLGLAAGALALTRENALVWVAVLGGWALVGAEARQAGRTRVVAVYAAGVLALLGPVAARNYAVGGEWFLTTAQFGPNFYIGNHAGADGSYVSLRPGRGSPEFERRDAIDLAQQATGRVLSPAEVSAYWRDRALAFIASDPAAWFSLMARKALLLVNAREAVDTESQESYAEWSWPLRVLGTVMHPGVLLPLAVLGAWCVWPSRRRFGVLAWLGVTLIASTLAFYVLARYRLPLIPFLIVGAATALADVGRIRHAWPSRSILTALGLAVLLAVAAQWPLLPADRSRAITENNLGAALHERGRDAEAATRLRRAIAIRADYTPAYSNLGVALRALGEVDAAIEVYRQGLALTPDDSDLHYNLANALLARGRADEAAVHLRAAAQGQPDSAGTRNNLGLALYEQGRFTEAVQEFEAAVALDPSSVRAHLNLGKVLADLRRPTEALSHLRTASSLAPGDADAQYDLGVALLEQGLYADAIVALSAATAARPGYAEAHNNLGIALASQGKLPEAIVQFELALRLRPGFESARANLALARRAIP